MYKLKNNINQLIIILLALGAFVTGTAEFVVSGILELISFELDVSISIGWPVDYDLFFILCYWSIGIGHANV